MSLRSRFGTPDSCKRELQDVCGEERFRSHELRGKGVKAAMNTIWIAGWSSVGIIVAGCLRLFIQRFALLPVGMPRLAPPAVLEVVTGALFAALACRIGAEFVLVAYSWLAAAGVTLAAIDWSTGELPTRLVWPSGIVLVTLFGFSALVEFSAWPLVRAVLGALVALAFYGVLYILLPGQLGGGDLRLGTLLGFALNWSGWPTLLGGTIGGWLVAALALAILRLAGRCQVGQHIRLGPSLVAGALAIVLVHPTS
jgi:leader peptidase (prepilin peptidase)/N-methyltransferase